MGDSSPTTMFTMPILVACGPCLMMALASVTLLVVHRSLSRVRHVLIWAAAFAVLAARWGYAAIALALGSDPRGGLVFDLLGMAGALLFAGGFSMRAGHARTAWVLPLVVAAAAVALLVLFMLQWTPLRSLVMPLCGFCLFAWSATLVRPAGSRLSPAEAAVIAMLCAMAIVQFLSAVVVMVDQTRLVTAHGWFAMLVELAHEPASAAVGMFTLLLIASDFSAELRRMIHTDPLTGVLNRLGFEHAARVAVERARRRARPLSVAIADIDCFKDINDRHGHAAGDATLVNVARHFAAATGRDETVGRIGGEEFALLLPGSDGAAALARIELIRASLATLRVPASPDVEATASFGIAEYKPGESWEETIERADEGLYRSKRGGRNRSTLAPPALGERRG